MLFAEFTLEIVLKFGRPFLLQVMTVRKEKKKKSTKSHGKFLGIRGHICEQI